MCYFGCMEFLVLIFAMQIAGLMVIGYFHMVGMRKNAEMLREIAMFKKAENLNDILVMKNMGLQTENWEKEHVEIKEEEILSPDELSEKTLEKIREQL